MYQAGRGVDSGRVRTRLVVSVAFAAVVAAPAATSAVGAGGHARPHVVLTPSSGFPATRFAVTFRTPRPNGPGRAAAAPRRVERQRYRESQHLPQQRPGDRAGRAGRRPGARDARPRSPRGRWCTATYHGEIDELQSPVCPQGKLCPTYVVRLRVVARFSFRVRASADATPPAFAGLDSAMACTPGPQRPGQTTPFTLTWKAATDGVTPSSQLVYDVFVSGTSGGEDFSNPSWTTPPGVTTYRTPGLPSHGTFYFVVRARDRADNEDRNRVAAARARSLPLTSIRARMTYELPDGTELTLPDGATGADAAAAIGPGLARAALAVKVDGEVRDLARPLPEGGGKLEIVTERSGEDALELIRHDAAHVLATAVMELYPGVKISIGPPIEDGFYYDFEFPDGVSLSDADFARDRSAHARAHQCRRAVRARGGDGRRGARALRPRGPGLQGRADRGSGRKRPGAARDRLALHQRRVHRSLPRSPRPVHEADQGVQAAVGRRRLLARRCRQGDAHARVWDRVLLQAGSRGLPRAARAGPRQRSPQARTAARAVHVLRGGARLGVLVPGGTRGRQLADRAQPGDGGAARIRRGEDAAALRPVAVGDLRPLGEVPRTTCSSPSPRTGRWRSSR